MNAPTEMPAPLNFTDNAAAKVKELFDEVTNEDDTVMEKDGVSLLIDPMSYQYLVGAEIDYSEGLEGSQFVIKNPNATSTCGCGSSFSS
ncbi:MAG: iron-sulfur cluster assembly accessory protein [Rhodocyclales bacterium]|nr:iron-sulfur cluster assembly accessory protein [Rhodocyclales bacterium]